MKKILLVLLSFLVFSCGKISDNKNTLMMATTTSTDNTGLLDYLAPRLKKDTGMDLKWTAVGTGKALAMGRNCDVDILMVHAPAAEKEFVEKGFGVKRTEIMYNDFVIIGPANDPAGISGKSINIALNTIKKKKIIFASRGDNSGTHKKEKTLWKASKIQAPEKEKWYIQTGQGMLNTINIAAEKKGYTLTDRGTYIKYESTMKGNPPLKIIVEGDKNLINQYSTIIINKDKCGKTKTELAEKFNTWITSENIQKYIGDFKLLNKKLFTPNAAIQKK